MDIPFTNDGTVDVIAGNLIFQQGMDNGSVVIGLGDGTLDGQTTAESGDHLIARAPGSHLVKRHGQPGDRSSFPSPCGVITQQSNGVLEISWAVLLQAQNMIS